ncbi:hypothetical protein CTRU02_205972 [Colletotrichum truncatum]|uniref:Uncharacterized protein n=1 Tax=Colletotrichum truncatum TaxID=5467 RepID=A0ACC3Z5I7_COLTU
MGERTGSRVFQWVWSYVLARSTIVVYKSTSEQSKVPSETLSR